MSNTRCLMFLGLVLLATPAAAADPERDRCSDSLAAIEMRDAGGLRSYASFIERDMAGLNQVGRKLGTGAVDFSDTRWGTPAIRGQQVDLECQRRPDIQFSEAVLSTYHGYRVASHLPPILPKQAR